MSMTLRYAGDFLSRKGVHWRCEILQESDVVLPVGELTFPSDEPLTIEWEEKSLEEVICPSKAVLTIESPGDRTYTDLYTIKPGQIRLDVYRYVPAAGGAQKTLYWSGCLDPEFYEEPYDRGANYDVELTFSDFGILKRIPYDLSGRNTLAWVLASALDRSRIAGAGVGTHISTKKVGSNSTLSLYDLQIASENFFDEDGEAMDYYKVVEGILQPLALRMVQHQGGVWVYDINALRALGSGYRKKINWNGTGQTMGVDNVFNNIKVTFSPYSSAELLDGKLQYDEPCGPEYTNITNDPPESGPECYSYYIDYDPAHRQGYAWDYNLVGFTIFRAPYYNPKVKGISSIGSSNRFFKIYPNLGGQESEGVIGGFRSQGHGPLTSGWTHVIGINPTRHMTNLNTELAFRTNKAYIPKLSADDASKFYLRIREEILVDPRYNPFEDASEEGNEGSNFDTFKSYASMAFVPVVITLYSEQGVALYHYSNRQLVLKGHPDDSVRATLGSWVAGAGSWGDAFLAYYNPDDMLTDTGLGGWKANHQCFGKPWTTGRKEKKRVWHYEGSDGSTKDFYMFDSMKKIPDGQFIPYPPVGGYLEVAVYNGVWIFDDTERYSDAVSNTLYNDKYGKLRWQLYKIPEVSVVRRTLTYDKAETDDVEYSGVANENAKEALELETICGTTPVVCPSAKGNLLDTNGEPITELVRAGRTDCPEHLLIGTLYSQFADRRTVLSGEAEIPFGHLGTFYDEAQEDGKLFLIKGQVQDIIEDTTEAVFVEIRPDEYDGEG